MILVCFKGNNDDDKALLYRGATNEAKVRFDLFSTEEIVRRASQSWDDTTVDAGVRKPKKRMFHIIDCELSSQSQ